jgi:predicted Fe-Mo cluster-binding NifX family protein
MKIAFPTQQDVGIKSSVYGHFGSARFFVVVDLKTGELEAVANQDIDHIHGMCQPMVALGGKKVDAVVVGGIGGGALRKLGEAGIKTYRAVEGTVSENLELVKTGKLPEFTMAHTCAGHQIGGECAH